MKKTLFPFGVAGLIVLSDQAIKWLVSTRCSLVDTKVLIPYLLEFCYLHNTGAAMGMFQGARWPLIVITSALIVGCAIYLIVGKNLTTLMRYALAMIAGGGVANLIDRIFRGYVIDFVRFPIPWFSYSFNIADAAICVGAALLVLDCLITIFKERAAKES